MASDFHPPCTFMWSRSMLWSKAQHAPDLLREWKPKSADGSPMLVTRALNATLTLLAVITLVDVLVVTENSGISECLGSADTTALRAVTGQMVLS